MRARALGLLAVVVLVLSSGCTHAGPFGQNRETLPPPLKGACWPLPVVPHVQMQPLFDTVRGDVRILRVQYDRVSASTARRRFGTALVGAGFTRGAAAPPSVDSSAGLKQARRAGISWFSRADVGTVGVSAFPIPHTAGYLVHGIVLLILPASTLATAPAQCPPPVVRTLS